MPRTLRRVARDPHAALAGGAAAVLLLELGRQEAGRDYAWLLIEAVVAGLALAAAWRRQDGLRLAPVLGLGLLLQLGLVALALGYDVRGDVDASAVYPLQGNTLLDGEYPRSEYPPGAVLLFGLEVWLGGGAARTANALLMVPCQLVLVAAIWAVRTRWSPWLAAFVALWPLDAFFWLFKFDLLVTVLLVGGLVLALRERWPAAGAALGAGFLVKWSPLFALLPLVAWLLAGGRRRAAALVGGAFAAVVALVYVPVLAWSPDAAWYAYDYQGGRRLTAESGWFLPLHWLGLAGVHGHISEPAGGPAWADDLAAAVGAVLVVAALVAAWRLVRSPAAAVALAALLPASLLLTNRIFSPQFLVTVVGAWALAGSLVVRTARQQLAVGAAAAVATTANVLVYPFALPRYGVTWQVCSFVLFAVSLALTGWLVWQALGRGQVDPSADSLGRRTSATAREASASSAGAAASASVKSQATRYRVEPAKPIATSVW
jgi:hypothetical protein